jgi:alpha-glucosidase
MSGKLQSTKNTSLGKLTEWKEEASGIMGETTNGRFRIQFYGEQIVRVTITQNNDFEDFSYALVVQPEKFTFEKQDANDELLLKTPSLHVKVTKDPVRISFSTVDGKLINEDDPAFGTSWNGEQVCTYKKLQEGERFVGLGEKTGPLDRRGSGYINWNTDNFGYGSGADPLYCSIPFYIGLHNGLSYGIFLDNSYKTFFNFGASNNRFASFAADAGEMNYYFMHSPTVAGVIQQYTHLTGTMELPPLWSIGYQQCRYSYYPDKEVLSIANTFREKDIPADAIVFDIHYMEKYKIFTWSKRDFPDPKGLLDKLKAQGFKVVIMCDPGIKVEDGYESYDDGVKKDVFIKYPDGTHYTGQVWPGWCVFPDFTKPATRQWWKEHFKEYVALGVEGFWNDMNEIATWGNMLPENIEMDFEGNGSTMRRGRNIYALQMAKSTYEGTKSLMNNRRPFNLTRSGFSGIQRYAAVWTGDNVAYDEHMMLGIRIVNSMGLSGIAFAGYDVGGFVGNADSKLFARWISIGALSPFFRGHSMINSRDAEPWSYGEEVEQISRNYIKFRYQILPYLYAAFYEASVTGLPVQRSLAISDSHDSKVYEGTFQHQYLLGPSILVAPVESNKDFVKVYFPEADIWYSVYNGATFASKTEVIVECPLHRLPVYIKGGAIIPMQHSKHHTGEKSDLLILHVYAGTTANSITFYEDDGSTFDYQNDKFAKRVIEYSPDAKRMTLHAASGSFSTPYTKTKLVLHGFEGQHIQTLMVNKNPKQVVPSVNSFFSGLEKYDPIKDPEPAPTENVLVAEFEYTAKEIVITW